MNKIIIQLCYLLLINLIVQSNLQAQTMEQLVDAQKISLNVKLINDSKIVVKQPVVIAIEVATPNWFIKGITFQAPQIAKTVILPMEPFAINSNKKVNGSTWASQTREFTVYPMHQGTYNIPAIEISVSVSNGKGGVITGNIFTKPLTFQAKIPQQISAIENYIISSKVNLAITGELLEKNKYTIGDAVTQTIIISAENVPAMMLPIYQKPEINGVSIYLKPVQLEDKKSRGSHTGTRTTSLTYIFEKSGEFSIPAQEFYWWNTTTNKLSIAKIPNQKWSVTGKNQQTDKDEKINLWLDNNTWLIIFALLFVLLLLIKLFHSIAKASQRFDHKNEYKQYRLAYIKAIKQNEYVLACNSLYKIYHLKYGQFDSLHKRLCKHTKKQDLLISLFQLAYSNKNNDITFTVKEAKSLLPNRSDQKNQMKKVTDNKQISLNI